MESRRIGDEEECREKERERKEEKRECGRNARSGEIFERAAKLFPLCRSLSRYLGDDLDFDQFRPTNEEEKNSMVSLFSLSQTRNSLSLLL